MYLSKVFIFGTHNLRPILLIFFGRGKADLKSTRSES